MTRRISNFLLALLVASAVLCVGAASEASAADKPIKVLFLGDSGHHRPADRFKQIEPILHARGIEAQYTENIRDLNPEKLKQFGALLVYANIDNIDSREAKALIDYVEAGGGFVPLHCASYCFRNAPEVVALMGGQFLKHGTGVFRTKVVEPGHPLMKGFSSFESWDETYVHHLHNEKGRTVLEVREDAAGSEPWTWVRTQGKGRVFYTAWGHDERTWGNPGFQNLLERGIRWAAGDDPAKAPAYGSTNTDYKPEVTAKRTDVKPFEYQPANVPIYTAGARWGTMGTPQKQMQKSLDPAESLKHLITPKDLEPRLFVAEPELGGKPIFMTWDERGRLWVCETYDYPNELQPKGQGRDRIRICEDTDGDGSADKFTVFAEKLSIPTTITFYRGGALVQQGGETTYLKDTNGDNVADLRKTLVTGWNMRDTHGEVSNFRYGLDNWYYAMQGYNDSRPVLTDGKQVQSFKQGFFRFKLEGDGEKTAVTEIEFLRSTNNNTWGLGISEEGLIFGSTANGNPSEFLSIPNRYYEAVRGWSSSVLNGIADSNRIYPITDNVRQVDHHNGFTAAAGHALYTARNYPQPYWNRTAFVAEPTGHLIATFVIRPDGAGFRSKNSWNLVASDDEWTSPIQAEVGPDGNIWFCDWYNFIVQHNPTPQGFRTGKGAAYETELRDKKHGRIYRLLVTGKEDQKSAIKSLDEATPEQLVAALKSDNMFWRSHAQRLLVERGELDVVPSLVKLAGDESVDEIGLNPGVIHALWTLHGLGAMIGQNPDAVTVAWKALKHRSAGVRLNAVKVLPRDAGLVKELIAAKLLDDSDAQVRMAALLALSEVPASADAGAAVAAAILDQKNYSDAWLPDAATSAAAVHDIEFLRSIAAAKQTPAPVLKIVARVAEHYARGGPVDTVADLMRGLVDAPAEGADTIVGGLARGWPEKKPARTSSELDDALAALLPRLPRGGQGQLVKLASALGSQGIDKFGQQIAESLLAALSDDARDEKERIDAASQLVEFRSGDEKLIEPLLENVTPRTSPALAVAIVEAVGRIAADEVGPAIIARLAEFTPTVKTAAYSALLRQSKSTEALLEAIEKGQAQLADLSLDQKQALADHPDSRIQRRAKQVLASQGGLPSSDRQKVIEEISSLVLRKADASQGKEIYKQQCGKCHTHSGEGGKVGPDLTGMAVHPKEELLVHILDPSRSVEGNYRQYNLLTDDGQVLSGLLSSETKTAVDLTDAEGKKHTVLRENIEKLVVSPKSIMPEGFEKQVAPEAIANLLEFLTQRGKYVPLDLRKVATAVSTRGMFISEDAAVERLIFDDWSPKTFDGVPFNLVDPQGGTVPNAVLLYGPNGTFPPKMPKSVSVPFNGAAKSIHLLSGVSGWGFPFGQKGTVSMIVRLHYADGEKEDHELVNGEQMADYIRRVDVPGSKFAFSLKGRQIRYLSVEPKRGEPIEKIELVKGKDDTAPVVMAITVESRQ